MGAVKEPHPVSWWVKTATFAVVANFLLNIIVIILVLHGVSAMHVKAKDLGINTASTRTVMMKTSTIVDNVQAMTTNLVPITAIALNSTEEAAANNTFAQAATDAMIGVGHADWGSFIGNATIAVGTVGNINFTVITDFLRMGQNTSFQDSIKQELNHALGTFDYASMSATSLVNTFRNGVLKESSDKS